MFHPPNPDLIAAVARVPGPGTAEGRMAEHRRTLLAARRQARRAAVKAVLRRLFGRQKAAEGDGSPLPPVPHFIRSATGIGAEMVHSSTTAGLPALVSTIR